ncbi:pyruvate kinase alpha/beta domain-containing protein, partial [Streptococcus anginosus]|nr:pyruvate kinase alpha/beta domain-containing protein [Streptococcus anginosus]
TIVAATDSGFTAKMISKYRPNATILALTFSESRANKLMLSSGVEPIVAERPATTDDMMILAANLAKENGYAQDGDKILVTAGVPVGERGTTNLMKIQIVGRQIVRGQGIGENSAVGHVVLAKDAKEANEKVTANSVLVVKTTDESYNDAISKAKAVIVEEGGVTSHAAVLGINTNTPVIVGAEGAVAEVTEGQLVTVDARRGVVYEGGDA